ncbi:MAG: hypothetical protein AB7N76_36315 [Planctomycetota bacterium]
MLVVLRPCAIQRCPLCLELAPRRELTPCPDCRTPFHTECARELRSGCPTLGCPRHGPRSIAPQRPATQRAAAQRPAPQTPARSRLAEWLELGAVLVEGTIILGVPPVLLFLLYCKAVRSWGASPTHVLVAVVTSVVALGLTLLLERGRR